MKTITNILFLLAMLNAYSAAGNNDRMFSKPPASAKLPVTDDYHGVTVIDDYRWLENFEDPAVREWVARENTYSRAYLDSIPFRQNVYSRLRSLWQGRSAQYKDVAESGGWLFALKQDPRKNQARLVMLKTPDDLQSEITIVDPQLIDSAGTTAIDWFAPSSDGKLVAVSFSRNGSEEGTVHLYETRPPKEMSDEIPRAQHPTAGGSLAWRTDSEGFFYTRYPHEGDRPKEDLNFYQQVYYHELGRPVSEDRYVFGKDLPKIAEIKLEMSEDGTRLLCSVGNGDGGDFEHFIMDVAGPSAGRWIQVTTFQDGIRNVTFFKNNLLMISTRKSPRGEVLSMPLSDLRIAAAKTLVPAGEGVIEKFAASSDRLYVVDLIGGPQQIRVFDLEGKPIGKLATLPVSSVDEITVLSNDELLYSNTSYIVPRGLYCYNPKTRKSVRTQMSGPVVADFTDTAVIRQFAVSGDGTRIPMNIIRRKGLKLNGRNPLLLWGYGGYNISEVPEFKYWLRMWIEQGGTFVVANIRGGGEYGEEWHAAGKLTKKQNVFDDFAACARWLIDKKYTNPSKLAIFGASNGGLLMGAELTQHPELFRAVVSRVGIYDMLRVEKSPNGIFNTTEFGSTRDSAQFKAIFAYSPYHHVKDGVKYPAVLMATGDHDGRVDPMQSRKMIALLQSASSSGLPVLLRTSAHAGHGMGSSQEVVLSEYSDIFSFLFDQLGMGYTVTAP